MRAITSVGLLVFAIFLVIARLFGLGYLLKWIGDTFYNGNGAANWGTPDLVTGKEKDVGKLSKLAEGEGANFEKFDAEIAKAALILASVIYESFDTFKDFAIRLRQNGVLVSQVREVHLNEAGSYIRILFFRFATAPHKVVIGVIFKGTDPHNITEWLTNFTMTKVDASEYLWGAIHEGYYSKFFFRTPKKVNAYDDILKALKEMVQKEEQLQQNSTEQEQEQDHEHLQQEHDELAYSVFTTGHSLGGALSSVFYSRLLKAPGDLLYVGNKLHFLGAYTFGAPRVGNFDFMRGVIGHANTPAHRSVNCWRVLNALDVAADTPFGEDDRNVAFITNSGDPQDFLDFSHIGLLYHLHNTGRKQIPPGPYIINSPGTLFAWITFKTGAGDFVDGIIDFFTSYWLALFGPRDLMNYILALIPPIGDHLTFRYYLNLERLEI